MDRRHNLDRLTGTLHGWGAPAHTAASGSRNGPATIVDRCTIALREGGDVDDGESAELVALNRRTVPRNATVTMPLPSRGRQRGHVYRAGRRSMICLRFCRSLWLVRRIAAAMAGAAIWPNPAGSPRLRKVMRVWLSSMAVHV